MSATQSIQSPLFEGRASLQATLKPFTERFERMAQEAILALGKKTPLRDACEYALMAGGKRIRPAIVFMVADALGHGFDPIHAALSIEYFHASSLIADDLPCMDNDETRRGKPTCHVAFGETIALLASFALIAAGYEEIAKAGKAMGEKSGAIVTLALENASINSGIQGLVGGQYADLYPSSPKTENLLEMIRGKTGAYFEVALVFGWLFGGGDFSHLDAVKEIGQHLGVIFQIVDDLEDSQQDIENYATLNILLLLGREAAREIFGDQVVAHYLNAARVEQMQYDAVVHNWDRERYLERG